MPIQLIDSAIVATEQLELQLEHPLSVFTGMGYDYIPL